MPPGGQKIDFHVRLPTKGHESEINVRFALRATVTEIQVKLHLLTSADRHTDAGRPRKTIGF